MSTSWQPTDIDQTLAQVLFSFSILHFTVSSILFVTFWRSPVFLVRNQFLTLIGCLGSGLQMIESCGMVFLGESFRDNIWRQYSVPQAMAFVGLPQIVKSFLLLGKFEISQYIARRNEFAELRLNWFVKHRWIVMSPFPTAFIASLISMVIYVPSLLNDIPGEDSRFVYYLSNFIWIGLGLFSGIFLAVKLHHKYDKWGVKKEMKNLIIWLSILALIYAVHVLILKSSDVWYLRTFNWFGMWMCYAAAFTWIVTVPAVKAMNLSKLLKKANLILGRIAEPNQHRDDRTMELSKSDNTYQKCIPRLRSFLEDPEHLAAFKKHLQDEFSAENIAFVLEVQSYQRFVSSYKISPKAELGINLANMAFIIYRQYIPDGSPSQVNLPHYLVRKINEVFAEFQITHSQLLRRSGIINEDQITKDLLSHSFGKVVDQKTVLIRKSSPIQLKSISSSQSNDRDSSNLETSVELPLPPDFLNVFDGAEIAVMDCMERDSFVRFRVTKQYKNLLVADPKEEKKIPRRRDRVESSGTLQVFEDLVLKEGKQLVKTIV